MIETYQKIRGNVKRNLAQDVNELESDINNLRECDRTSDQLRILKASILLFESFIHAQPGKHWRRD